MSYKYEYAGFWIRVLATIIDTVLVVALMTPISLFWDVNVDNITQQNFTLTDLFWQIFCAAISIFLWIKYAGTPGKRLLGLKVLDEETGNNLTVNQAILRYLGYIASSIVFCLGFIWIAFDSKKQGWHDKIAKTVVVREL